MRLYLPGPQGPDQIATAAELRMRGYDVVCASEVALPSYRHNQDMEPSPTQFRQRQMLEMHEADAVVLPYEVSAAERHLIVQVCRFAGLRVLPQEELPALAPHAVREEELMERIDLAQLPVRSPRVPLMARLNEAAKRAEGAANWFNARYGWFFTNGQKAAQSKPYPPIAPAITTTA